MPYQCAQATSHDGTARTRIGGRIFRRNAIRGLCTNLPSSGNAGDDFYEQQQVLAQITDLTGRRYLADDTDALDQYRDLMNNATQVAKQFDLSVGVALTPAQMASLTQDIVWLVNVTVDGHQVLEPVVYLSAADAKNLAASGATIAGKNVILTASGDITNNGTIAHSAGSRPSRTPWHHHSPLLPGDSEKRGRFTWRASI